MKLKPPKTIEEQIEILKSRNLIIESEEEADKVLQGVNYYTLTGYLFEHRDVDGNFHNISFKQLYRIYQCDMRVRSLLLYAIESVERNLKTKISYVMACSYGNLALEDKSLFKNEQRYIILKDKFNQAVNHNKKYNNKFPIWVAIELFTLGMMHNLYDNLNTPIQKQIAKEFNVGSVYLNSWIDCVAYIRNLCAHNMRLYRVNIIKTPKQSIRHNKPSTITNKIFDIVYMLKHLTFDADEWKYYILQQFQQVFDEYSDVIVPDDYGFPNDWYNILSN